MNRGGRHPKTVVAEADVREVPATARTADVLRAVAERASQLSTDLEGDADPEAIIARLDEVIERLAGLDSLRADVNVLKARLDSSE